MNPVKCVLIFILGFTLSGCSTFAEDTSTLDKSCVNECGVSKRTCYNADTNNMVGPDIQSHQPRAPGRCQAEYHQCLKACRASMPTN